MHTNHYQLMIKIGLKKLGLETAEISKREVRVKFKKLRDNCNVIGVEIKGEVSPNNNVDWVSRKQFYKPNSKSLSRFG